MKILSLSVEDCFGQFYEQGAFDVKQFRAAENIVVLVSQDGLNAKVAIGKEVAVTLFRDRRCVGEL